MPAEFVPFLVNVLTHVPPRAVLEVDLFNNPQPVVHSQLQPHYVYYICIYYIYIYIYWDTLVKLMHIVLPAKKATKIDSRHMTVK